MAFERMSTAALVRLFRGAFKARRAEADLRREIAKLTGLPTKHMQAVQKLAEELEVGRAKGGKRRNILFITVDQQRFDALGVNGGRVARTPNLDELANAGFNYQRAHVQNVVCMPSRSTMLTGQHPHTHGVFANGVPLPDDAPSVAGLLRREAGYRTGLIGKAHFDPHLDPTLRFYENRCAAARENGPWHGFEHVELATHGPIIGHHYAAWLWEKHADEIGGFGGVLTGAAGGDTGAPEVSHNHIATEHYHTDWVANQTIRWLSSLEENEPWFCWMSFPDPHHPFDPPIDEVRNRIDWRDLELPAGHPGGTEAIEKILADKPQHWLDWYQGRFRNPEGGPVSFLPATLTHDQVREMNAMIHVENELIDDACGRVMDWLQEHDVDSNTDIFYTSDHGELQGDFGLMFKGPYHVESLLRVPLLWRPAPSAGVAPLEVSEPVGHVDLAPTFCQIAGIDVPDHMQGEALPESAASTRERVITTFDSQFRQVGMHLRTIYRDGFLCTYYEPRSFDRGGVFRLYWSVWGRDTEAPTYSGEEGELYDLRNDPHQWRNLWNSSAHRSLRNELVADLKSNLPRVRDPQLAVLAPT